MEPDYHSKSFLSSPMRPLDRTQIAKRFGGKWIAFKADRKTVVATGTTVRGALEAARTKGYSQPVITRMPKTLRSFVGSHWPR
jgi:Family of unknown function (DUF5678)